MQTVFFGRRIRAQRASRDADIGHCKRQPVLRRQRERVVERSILVVGYDEQPRKSAVDLLGGEAVRMRVKPVEPRTVFHVETQRFAGAGLDRVETSAVLRFRERKAVKVDRRGLRQPVFDHGIETIAAPRYQYRMRDPLPVQMGDVAAAAEQWVEVLDGEAPDRVERHDSASGQRGKGRDGNPVRGPAAESHAGGRGANRKKSSPVQSEYAAVVSRDGLLYRAGRQRRRQLASRSCNMTGGVRNP